MASLVQAGALAQACDGSVLTRDAFTCQMCGRVEGNTSQLVADHKQAHRGDASLFWDERNIQCLCKSCHDGAKQAIEKLSDNRFQ